MPDNIDTGEELLDHLAVMEGTGTLYTTIGNYVDNFLSSIATNNTTITTPTNGGLMEAVQQQGNYIEYDVDDIHRKFLEKWGLAYPEKPVTKLIKEDEDMGKVSNNKNMTPLEKEEIEKAIWTDQANTFFLKDLLEDSDDSKVYTIGKVGTGNIDRVPTFVNNSWLILGHRLDGKVYTTNKEVNSILGNKNSIRKREYIVYNLITRKIQLFDANTFERSFSPASGAKLLAILKETFKYKIIDSKLSGRVFGLGKNKAELVGTIVENVKLEFGESVRLKGSTWYAIVYNSKTDQNIKFCLTDLELILPNIKGYNFCKDRTIYKGNFVVLKRDEVKTVYRVTDIYRNSNSQRLMKNSNTRKLDVFLLTDPNNQLESKKVYAKNVKKVE